VKGKDIANKPAVGLTSVSTPSVMDCLGLGHLDPLVPFLRMKNKKVENKGSSLNFASVVVTLPSVYKGFNR